MQGEGLLAVGHSGQGRMEGGVWRGLVSSLQRWEILPVSMAQGP